MTKSHQSSEPGNKQSERFVKAARDLDCDEDPAHFEEKLKAIAKHKPDKASKSKQPKSKEPGQ